MARMTQSPACGITTVMIRNVPRKYSSCELVRELSRFFAQSEFDFVYVPWDKNGHSSMGLGFVNFRDGHGPAIAAQLMGGQEWTCAQYNRRIEVQGAHNQGMVENLRRYQENMARRGGIVAKHAPMVFEDGIHLPIDVALDKYCLNPESDISAREYPKYFVAQTSMEEKQERGAQAFQACAIGAEFFEEDESTSELCTKDWSPTASLASLPAFTERFSPPPGLSASPTTDSLPAFGCAERFPPPPGLSAAPSLDNLPFLVGAKRVPQPPGLSPSPTLDDLASIAGWDVPILELMASYKGPIAF